MAPEADTPETKNRVLREIAYYAVLIAALLAFRSTLAENYVIPSGSMEPTLKIGDYLFALKCAYVVRVPFTDVVLARVGEVRRGDIVIFPSQTENPPPRWLGLFPIRSKLIKRVVGVPGDRISVVRDHLAVNGQTLPWRRFADRRVLYDIPDPGIGRKALYVETINRVDHFVMVEEPYEEARFPPLAPFVNGRPDDFAPITVPPGMLFVMGDNRDSSYDSRYWGLVPIDAVLGRAGIVYLSVEKDPGILNWLLFRFRVRFERLGRIVR